MADQSPKSKAQSSKSQVSSPTSQDETADIRETGATHSKTHRHRNAGEIAGETLEVVGESTGRFPRVEAGANGGGESTGRSAFMVGAGILISRIIGVIRQRVFAYYLGNSDAAGAFSAAFRIPNFLQNVFGEGALSASFIPVYANLL